MRNYRLSSFSVILILFFSGLNVFSQTLKINSSSFYKQGTSEQNYFFEFSFQEENGKIKIDEIKNKSLSYDLVSDVLIETSLSGYKVQLLLDKKAENVSNYYSNYFKHIGINQIIIDEQSVKSEEFYSYLYKKYTKKEVVGN